MGNDSRLCLAAAADEGFVVAGVLRDAEEDDAATAEGASGTGGIG